MLVDNTLLLFFIIGKHFKFAAIYKWGLLLTFYEMCFMCFYVTCAFQQRWCGVCGSSFWCRWRRTNNLFINFHVWLFISWCKSSDKMWDSTYNAEMNVCFRCCWGCWQALRSSFPHAAAASTLRSPTTSCRWQAVRSGRNSLQQTKKLQTVIKITIGNYFSDSYVTTWFFFLPLFDWCKVKQSVSNLWFKLAIRCDHLPEGPFAISLRQFFKWWFCLLQVWSLAPQHVQLAQIQVVLQSVLASAGKFWYLVFTIIDLCAHIHHIFFLFIVCSILG